MEQFIFYIIFIITIGSACVVAFSRNLIYSAFALMGTFLGVAATFILLQAEFVGLVQVVVYAGGILILTVFAVMLTSKIESRQTSNPHINFKLVAPLAIVLFLLFVRVLSVDVWAVAIAPQTEEAAIVGIGNQLLGQYLLPFELVSIVLLAALIGAAIITRRQVK